MELSELDALTAMRVRARTRGVTGDVGGEMYVAAATFIASSWVVLERQADDPERVDFIEDLSTDSAV